MKTPTLFTAVSVFLLLGGWSEVQGAVVRTYPVVQDYATQVDELMAAYRASDGPGGVVAVMQHGEVILARAYGMANVEHAVPMRRESVLDIGSTAKQFTAFAVVLLEEQGKLSFDDDIREHLPEIPDFGSVITIRHLIHHQSGLREIYNSKMMAGWQGGDGISQTDAIHLTSRMRELNFEPGTEYLYCNTGYMLLADIVARVSGMSFPDFLSESVFLPLGMTHTTIMSQLGQSILGAAESYARMDDDGWVRIFDNSSLFGAGGIYTTVDDLAKWMANYATGQVGGAAAIEQMQKQGVLADGKALPYAFGIGVGSRRGLRTLAHGGASAGYRTSFTYYPEIDGGVITMSNHAQFDGSIGDQVADLFFGDEMDPEAPDAASAGEDAQEQVESDPWTPGGYELAEYEGQYYSPELETIYTLQVEGGRLMASHRRLADFELAPESEGTFSGPVGTVTFERNGAGEVTGLRMSNGRVLNMLFERFRH
jgi:CubicO group peptidase (beta-lactamase class C family)